MIIYQSHLKFRFLEPIAGSARTGYKSKKAEFLAHSGINENWFMKYYRSIFKMNAEDRFFRIVLIAIFSILSFTTVLPSSEALQNEILQALHPKYHIDDDGYIYYYPFLEQPGSWLEQTVLILTECIIARWTLISIDKRDDDYIAQWKIECRGIDGEKNDDWDGIGYHFAGTDEKPVRIYPLININDYKHKLDTVQINDKEIVVLIIELDDLFDYYLSNDIPSVNGYIGIRKSIRKTPFPCPDFLDFYKNLN